MEDKELTLPVDLINYFVDPRIDIWEKADVLTMTGTHMWIPKQHMMVDALSMLRAAYHYIADHVAMEDYEACAIIRRYIMSLRQAYRVAIQRYSDYTITEFRWLDQTAEKIDKMIAENT